MVSRLVLIDDDPEDIEFMVEAVKHVNPQAECRMFLDPCEAVAALKSRSFIPELVIIDLTMPDLSGLECLDQLRKLEYPNAVRFVLYSSAKPSKELLDCLAPLGATAFQKPSSMNELNTIIKGLME